MSVTYKEEPTKALSPEEEARLKAPAPAQVDSNSAGIEAAQTGNQNIEYDDENAFYVGEWDMTALANEFMETGGLSEESYAELEEGGFPREVVDIYIEGYKARAAQSQQTKTAEQATGGLSEADALQLLASVGGEEKYNSMLAWAEKNFSAAEIKAFNKAVVESGDKDLASFAIAGLAARYAREYGQTPRLVKQTAGRVQNAGFANRDEMLAAMRDQRYGREKSYTQSVEEKVRKSNFYRG